MPDMIHSKTEWCAPHAHALGAAALLAVMLAVAGCGASSSPSGGRVATGERGTAGDSAGRGLSPEGVANPEQSVIAYAEVSAKRDVSLAKVARCVRLHGIHGFPDPQTLRSTLGSGGGAISGIHEVKSPAAFAVCGIPAAQPLAHKKG